ncbi:MAG: hypothetical protein JW834_00020 [Candidatus Diapherotrites archaeon]|nr:hypothetical protein [Candidatus Diapherotrites archaeon]
MVERRQRQLRTAGRTPFASRVGPALPDTALVPSVAELHRSVLENMYHMYPDSNKRDFYRQVAPFLECCLEDMYPDSKKRDRVVAALTAQAQGSMTPEDENLVLKHNKAIKKAIKKALKDTPLPPFAPGQMITTITIPIDVAHPEIRTALHTWQTRGGKMFTKELLLKGDELAASGQRRREHLKYELAFTGLGAATGLLSLLSLREVVEILAKPKQEYVPPQAGREPLPLQGPGEGPKGGVEGLPSSGAGAGGGEGPKGGLTASILSSVPRATKALSRLVGLFAPRAGTGKVLAGQFIKVGTSAVVPLGVSAAMVYHHGTGYGYETKSIMQHLRKRFMQGNAAELFDERALRTKGLSDKDIQERFANLNSLMHEVNKQGVVVYPELVYTILGKEKAVRFRFRNPQMV